MIIDSVPVPKNGRITGTLHTRGYVHPILMRDESLAREKVEDSEGADLHRDGGPEDHKDVR